MFYMHHPRERIALYHSFCDTSCGALAGTRNSSKIIHTCNRFNNINSILSWIYRTLILKILIISILYHIKMFYLNHGGGIHTKHPDNNNFWILEIFWGKNWNYNITNIHFCFVKIFSQLESEMPCVTKYICKWLQKVNLKRYRRYLHWNKYQLPDLKKWYYCSRDNNCQRPHMNWPVEIFKYSAMMIYLKTLSDMRWEFIWNKTS